ncbi:MAG TPA: hypothetical protein VGN26_09990 [Armatimonadota bacterium]
MSSDATDNRAVVLLKSDRTGNRFYALAPEGSGWKNADTISDYPPDVILGIAYPCLEDGLNDFATIRTTFETLDYFPDDQQLRTEMMDIILEARAALRARLGELRDRLATGQAHFLGTVMEDFKSFAITLATKGQLRRTLDSMMKLDVFESVAQQDEATGAAGADASTYTLAFLPENRLELTRDLPGREFVVRMFDDLMQSVSENGNYESRYTFDKSVFQKFIALMFINYATTDPIFYGTNRADYGVSADRDMQDTPLYRAVGAALRDLESSYRQGLSGEVAVARPAAEASELGQGTRTLEVNALPTTEQNVLNPLNAICRTARLLAKSGNPRDAEYGGIILKGAQGIFQELKAIGLVSPMAQDPSA